jgi:polyhydroxyalkanoate synthesis repressor PhaR
MEPTSHEAASTRRLIKRYSNRKLYDTQGSRYVTLLEIAEMVRSGEEVQIIDNATKEDKTEVTLALIISEELKERPRGIPISTLKALIRHRGERLLTTLRDGPIGRLIPREEPSEPAEENSPSQEAAPEDPTPARESEAPPPPSAAPSPPSLSALRRTLEQWQAAVDERIRAVLPHSNDVEELKLQVQAVNERLAALEERLRAVEKNPE